MLKTLRQAPLLVGMAEVLVDAVRYVVIVLVVLLLLGQVVAARGADGTCGITSDRAWTATTVPRPSSVPGEMVSSPTRA